MYFCSWLLISLLFRIMQPNVIFGSSLLFHLNPHCYDHPDIKMSVLWQLFVGISLIFRDWSAMLGEHLSQKLPLPHSYNPKFGPQMWPERKNCQFFVKRAIRLLSKIFRTKKLWFWSCWQAFTNSWNQWSHKTVKGTGKVRSNKV